jgi:hypothetical protein
VDHPAAAPELVRPWRTATLVASGIAAAELVLLIVAGLILLGKSLAPEAQTADRQAQATKPVAKAPTAAATVKAKPERPQRVAATLPRGKTHVIVLNGNGVAGAAAEQASVAESRGYRIRKVANAPNRSYAKTIVMYRPGFAGEARRFARDLNLSLVQPLDGMKPAQLSGAQILVIIGASR